MSQLELKSGVLNRVVSSLLPEGAGHSITPKQYDDRTEFEMEIPPAYRGRLVGQSGKHMRALQLIVEVLGSQVGQRWTLEMIEEEGWQKRPTRQESPTPQEHDESPDAELLADLLDALGINADVISSGGLAGGFDFLIKPDTRPDHSDLTDPHTAQFKGVRPGSPRINLISSLGIIWFAIGRGRGCEYRVNVEEP